MLDGLVYSLFLRTILDECPCCVPFLAPIPDLVWLCSVFGSDFFWVVLLFGTYSACGFLLPF